ncbi:MAG: lysine--tRNA ligase, partial [Actinomycetia bacterium]|nr:lysine--tRNA ligase [Actinomycetes bacterium]
VGAELVSNIYRGQAPEYEAYSFVGTTGSGKMSSSKGAVPTPLDALEVFEVPILRWMYVRKTPRQSFSVDLASGIYSIYDDWDALSRKVAAGEAAPSQVVIHQRARRSHLAGEFPVPDAIVAFRTLTSAVSVAAGDETQLARIVGELTEVDATEVARTEPRLGLAGRWVDGFAPESERIRVREQPDRDRLASLNEQESTWLKLLLAHLEDDWSLEGARTLVWDLDPQGAASFYFRVKPKVKGGSKSLLKGKRSLDNAIKGT